MGEGITKEKKGEVIMQTAKYNTVEIMLITSDKQYKPREKYATDVEMK